MHTLYGIPNCDTVKKARSFLDVHSIPYLFIDFKKQPPTSDLILQWETFLGEIPINSKGTTYKKLKDVYLSLNEADKIKFLCKNSSMLKRPILTNDKTVLFIGFNVDSYKKVLLNESSPTN
ncbi:MAG: arsenate reductase family protein [Bacteriovoracaceae bacterium]